MEHEGDSDTTPSHNFGNTPKEPGRETGGHGDRWKDWKYPHQITAEVTRILSNVLKNVDSIEGYQLTLVGKSPINKIVIVGICGCLASIDWKNYFLFRTLNQIPFINSK